MEAHASARRVAPIGKRRWLVTMVAAAALAVIAFLLVRAIADDGSSDGKLRGSGANRFTLSYPDGWSALSQKQLSRLHGSPVAVLRRDDRRGILIINRQRRLTHNLDKLSRGLDERLASRIPDFQKVSSHTVRTQAGRVFLYSYVRKRKGLVHSILVVPTRSGGYTLNAVVRAHAPDVARQVGVMFRRFQP
jgi:hypothetical protein